MPLGLDIISKCKCGKCCQNIYFSHRYHNQFISRHNIIQQFSKNIISYDSGVISYNLCSITSRQQNESHNIPIMIENQDQKNTAI